MVSAYLCICKATSDNHDHLLTAMKSENILKCVCHFPLGVTELKFYLNALRLTRFFFASGRKRMP